MGEPMKGHRSQVRSFPRFGKGKGKQVGRAVSVSAKKLLGGKGECEPHRGGGGEILEKSGKELEKKKKKEEGMKRGHGLPMWPGST